VSSNLWEAIDILAICPLLDLMDALKLLVILIAIIIALRKKVPVGVALFGAGPLAALLYQVNVNDLGRGYLNLLGSERFIFLTGVVILITILGHLLKELGALDRLTRACRKLYGGARTATVILPLLIGLMPMPAGSLLSAPLVDNVLKDFGCTPHFKCAANYWFRHLAEFAWPIYAGLILTEGITGLPIGRVALLQLPLSLTMILIGLFFFVRRIESKPGQTSAFAKPVLGILSTIWPVLAAIFLYGAFKIDLTLAVLIAVVALVVVDRPSKTVLLSSLKKGLSYKLILLVYGILSFQMILELSGGIESIPRLATVYNLPVELIIFLVCFSIGILTGMVSAYVGLGYALLAGFLYQPEIIPANIMIAYLSGFIGVMLSPTHLCLIFTIEYFGADLLKVYRILAWPLLILGLVGYLLYLSGYGSLFR